MESVSPRVGTCPAMPSNRSREPRPGFVDEIATPGPVGLIVPRSAGVERLIVNDRRVMPESTTTWKRPVCGSGSRATVRFPAKLVGGQDGLAVGPQDGERQRAARHGIGRQRDGVALPRRAVEGQAGPLAHAADR